jgi:cellulose synthase/poly-beta-1,6-N-acetylglucosamine synthase-like glycosyltransferase
LDRIIFYISKIFKLKGKNIKSIHFFLIILIILITFKNNKNYEVGLNKELRSQKKKMKIMEKYFKICNNGIVLNKNEFKKVKEPKISIISPIYNKEKCILRFLRSIQNQFFDDIEIILIDDHSKDNTIKIIENIQKEDERIILIKHNENKGTLISRNEGAIISKSKYLIFADPDDILSNDVLSFSYETIEKNNYDIVRYNIYIGNNKISLDSIVNEIKSKPIYQPELSLYIFYGTGELIQNDYLSS